MGQSLLTSAATIIEQRLKHSSARKRGSRVPDSGAETELLLLPSGEILVHNLTPEMARLLVNIDPALGVRLGMSIKGTKNTKREDTNELRI